MARLLKLEINISGAAFEDETEELYQIFKKLTKQLSEGYNDIYVHDTNGNKCGRLIIVEFEEVY